MPILSRVPYGLRLMLMAVLVVAGSTASANAQVRRSADDVISMVDAAIAHYDEVGREQALSDFSDPDGEFIDGEIYMVIQSYDPVMVVSHPYGHHLMGPSCQRRADRRERDRFSTGARPSRPRPFGRWLG